MNQGHVIRSTKALEAITRLRALTSDLPEVSEATDKFGHVSFRVRDKPFALVGEGDGNGSMAIKSLPETQRFLIERRGFRRTPYIGHHGWVSVPHLPPQSWDEVEELVVDGYRLAAPPSLAELVEDVER